MALSKGGQAGVGGPQDRLARVGVSRPSRGATPQRLVIPPDPFEDIAAPPLRTTPDQLPSLPAPAEKRPSAVVLRLPEPEAHAKDAPPPEEEIAGTESADCTVDKPRVAERVIVAGREDDAHNRSEARPAPVLELAPPVAPARPRTSGSGQLLIAVITGLVLALAMVALALHFRPVPGVTDVPAARVETAALDPAPPAAATPVADAAVRLRFGPGLPEAERTVLREAVLASGFAAVDLSPLPFPVDRARIEYFRPADRPAAENLAAALQPLAGEIDLRDLTETDGAAEPGRIDAWLAN